MKVIIRILKMPLFVAGAMIATLLTLTGFMIEYILTGKVDKTDKGFDVVLKYLLDFALK